MGTIAQRYVLPSLIALDSATSAYTSPLSLVAE